MIVFRTWHCHAVKWVKKSQNMDNKELQAYRWTWSIDFTHVECWYRAVYCVTLTWMASDSSPLVKGSLVVCHWPCQLQLHHDASGFTPYTRPLTPSLSPLPLNRNPRSPHCPLYRLPVEIHTPVYVIQSTATSFISAESNLIIWDLRTSSTRHQLALFTSLRRPRSHKMW